MTEPTDDALVQTPDRNLLRMPIFVTPLEADILTWFELVSKRDDGGRLRIGCPDDPEALHACWASDRLGCTPEEYAESLQRFEDSGIIRRIAHSDVTGKTTYVIAAEPEDLWPIPIKRRAWTWLDPTVYDALEAIQQTFQAKFAGVVPPTRDQVANRLGTLPPLDESDRIKESLFGPFLGKKEPTDGLKTAWGVFAHDGEGLRFMPCNPHFMAYRFSRGRPEGAEGADDREPPTFDKVDPSAVPCLDGATSDDRFLTVVTSDGRAVMAIRRPVPASLLLGTCESEAIIRACSPDELSAIRRELIGMSTRISAEETRRERLSSLRGDLSAVAEQEALLLKKRREIEGQIAKLES